MKKRTKTVRVQCTLHEAAFKVLTQLNTTGLFGNNLSQTVERLLCKSLREEIMKGASR